MEACYKHVDAPISVDADGVVLGDDGLDGIEIDL
jgi:predicted double-glycine peptidase